MAADKALILAGTYEIPSDQQEDQETKTAWVQSAVEDIIQHGSNVLVSYNESEEEYSVTISKGSIIDIVIIEVTEE